MRQRLIFLFSVVTIILGGSYLWGTTVSAQDTACIGAAAYVAAHQQAEINLKERIDAHADIYAKDAVDLTEADLVTVAADVEAYASELAAIDAPDPARATWSAEVAMYFTLAAMLESANSPTQANVAPLFNEAGKLISGGLAEEAKGLVISCATYSAVYGEQGLS